MYPHTMFYSLHLSSQQHSRQLANRTKQQDVTALQGIIQVNKCLSHLGSVGTQIGGINNAQEVKILKTSNFLRLEIY